MEDDAKVCHEPPSGAVGTLLAERAQKVAEDQSRLEAKRKKSRKADSSRPEKKRKDRRRRGGSESGDDSSEDDSESSSEVFRSPPTRGGEISFG